MTNREKLRELFPYLNIVGTVFMDKHTEQVLATSVNFNWLDAEYQEPITKNDLEVDCVSRAYLLDDSKYHTVFNDDTGNFEDVVYREDIEKAPSVTPQEPFINKPCISSGVCEHDKNVALDKIKAEIKEWYWQADKQALAKDPCMVDAMIDLFIRTIDKYKAERKEVDADSN